MAAETVLFPLKNPKNSGRGICLCTNVNDICILYRNTVLGFSYQFRIGMHVLVCMTGICTPDFADNRHRVYTLPGIVVG